MQRVFPVGTGLREVIVLLVVAGLAAGVIVLFLPRRRVPFKVKRIIACVWIAAGILQILSGAGSAMAVFGFSEVVLFGGALLVFTEKRWVRIVGGCAIFLGLVLLVAASAQRPAAADEPLYEQVIRGHNPPAVE